jgi:hypothetical protein
MMTKARRWRNRGKAEWVGESWEFGWAGIRMGHDMICYDT